MEFVQVWNKGEDELFKVEKCNCISSFKKINTNFAINACCSILPG